MKIKILIINLLLLALVSCGKETTSNFVTPQGKSGSEARMIIVGNYMYVVNKQDLKTFDITNASNPIEKNSTYVGFDIETIFPFASYLFIGSTDGMYIYDISNPENPTSASSQYLEHYTACDPVVANGNYAYVTLNTFSKDCRNEGEINEMQVVNIQNILNPQVVNTIQMQGPKGLGIDGNHLFVCDKDLGVIVFDLTNPSQPIVIDTISGFTANDLIPDNGNLMVISTDGLRQFDYTDINNISLISYLDLND